MIKLLERLIAHPTMMGPFITLQDNLDKFKSRDCKKCGTTFYVVKHDYVPGYFDASLQRLCPPCFKKINVSAVRKNIRKKKLRAASQYKNEGTRNTKKRTAFDYIDELINYIEESKAE